MEEIKWIKITTGVFDNRKIKQIDALPDSDSILVIWFKLLCLAGTVNERGYLLMTDNIAYTDEMLAGEFKRSLNTVRFALLTFQKFGMIELDVAPQDQKVIRVKNWEKYQSVDGMEKVKMQSRGRSKKYRDTQKLLLLEAKGSNDRHVTRDVTHHDEITSRHPTEREKEEEKDTTLSITDETVDKLIETLRNNEIKVINERDLKTIKEWLYIYKIEQIENAIAQSRESGAEYISSVDKKLKGSAVDGIKRQKQRHGTALCKNPNPDYTQSL